MRSSKRILRRDQGGTVAAATPLRVGEKYSLAANIAPAAVTNGIVFGEADPPLLTPPFTAISILRLLPQRP